jgi:hypothetical protein
MRKGDTPEKIQNLSGGVMMSSVSGASVPGVQSSAPHRAKEFGVSSAVRVESWASSIFCESGLTDLVHLVIAVDFFSSIRHSRGLCLE